MKGRLRSRRFATGVIAAVVAASTALTASGSASAGPVRPHFTTGGWIQLSTGGSIDIIENIGLARFGTSLQAVWVAQNADKSEALHTRIVSGAGTPTSADTTVQTGWGTLNEFPAVFANGSQRVIAFSGIQNTDGTNPYSQGYEYYLTSPDGTTWTLSNGALSQQATAGGSYGTDAVDAGGTPVAGYTDSLYDAISYHSGFVGSIPATPGTDPETPRGTCCSYDTGLGYDATTGQTWAIWYSNSAKAATNGVLAQQIEPSLGTQIQAPGSNVQSNGSNEALSPIQRYVTADRVGGGVHAGYFVGYPEATKIALWRLGASQAMVRSAGGNAQAVGTAAGPDGRVWLYWWDGGTHTIDAVRTDRSATRFGAVCKVSTPNSTEDVWDLVGNASEGTLQLFTVAGEPNTQVYDTAISPCLSVSLSPASISAATGGSFTATVSDAGAAIKGATVSFGGAHKTTNAAGKVTFTIVKHHKVGRFPVVVSSNGYQQASATARVH